MCFRVIAGLTVTCVASRVKNLHTGSHSCSWPDLFLACAIPSTGTVENSSYTITSVIPIKPLNRRIPFPVIHLFVSLSSRVVYIFGSHVKEPPTDITPTFLTTGVLSTLRQADFVAHSILRESGKYQCWGGSRHLKPCVFFINSCESYKHCKLGLTIFFYRMLHCTSLPCMLHNGREKWWVQGLKFSVATMDFSHFLHGKDRVLSSVKKKNNRKKPQVVFCCGHLKIRANKHNKEMKRLNY